MKTRCVSRSISSTRSIVLALVLSSLLIFMTWSPAAWAQEQPTVHDLLNEIGMRVPAFGGMFVDEEKDTLYVYLVPGRPGTLPELDQAITEVLGDARPPQHRLQKLDAQYTFLELEELYGQMQPRVLPMEGVLETGIDLVTNRLSVGVATLEAQPQVEAELAGLGIPREAVNLEQVPPMKDLAVSLSSKIRPMIGGIQITYRRNEEGRVGQHACTLGFIAVRNDVRGFITNSHCADKPFQLSNTNYYQPDIGFGGNHVGIESVNPLPGKVECSSLMPHVCPNVRCRCSDSLFATEDDDVVGTLGRVAAAFLNEPEYDPDDTYRIISGGFVVPGQMVAKVGKTTGRSEGRVTRVCVDERNSSNVLLLCQNVAELTAESGDSGAPVLRLGVRRFNGVSLLGILWGGSDIAPRAIFSPIEGVERDLGGTIAFCQNAQC
jgi:hypothetical protein